MTKSLITARRSGSLVFNLQLSVRSFCWLCHFSQCKENEKKKNTFLLVVYQT